MPTKKHKLPVLVSYAFLKDMSDKKLEELLSHPGMEILLDCGAFTALNAGYEIRLDEYMEFLQKWKKYLFGYMALDKLQDPRQTAANLRTMVSEGLKPIPVHVLGDDRAKMDELFELSEWIALGGLRRPHRGWAPVSYIKQKMEWAQGRRVHWLGYTKAPIVRAFRPYSCDCSNFASGQRWGLIQIYAGSGIWHELRAKRVFPERLYMRPDIRRAVADYDVSMQWFADPNKWSSHSEVSGDHFRKAMVTILPVRSWVRYSLDFKQRFGVRIFLASTPKNTEVLHDGLEYAESRGWTQDATKRVA